MRNSLDSKQRKLLLASVRQTILDQFDPAELVILIMCTISYYVYHTLRNA